ncbi:MAG: hypothetical protein UIM25_05225 [Bacteroidales bacterium]|nr:hypothetical protein [Bacteroidales bacterium]
MIERVFKLTMILFALGFSSSQIKAQSDENYTSVSTTIFPGEGYRLNRYIYLVDEAQSKTRGNVIRADKPEDGLVAILSEELDNLYN